MSSSIFKAYDVRGVYPDEVNEENIKLVANATANFLKAKTLVIGQDVRLSSQALVASVIDGVTALDCNIISIGQCTTPMFYFAVNHLGADGGIMVTASHNQPKYNGLKIVAQNSRPVDMGNGLGEIRRLASEGYKLAEKRGEKRDYSKVADEYVDFLVEICGIKDEKIKVKVVADASCGAASIVVRPLFDSLNIGYVPINFDIDGTFSKDNPNPLAPHAADHVSKDVLANKADIGVIFDGDADRLIVIDNEGKLVDAQYILALLWQSRGGKVVYDLRFSKAIQELFGSNGFVSKVGHTNIVHEMLLRHADVGGEMSGHLFFKETLLRESSELGALRIVEVLHKSGKKLSELISALKRYAHSGEINIEFSGSFEEVKSSLLKAYPKAKASELDGLTLDMWDSSGWWFNVRSSNTEPVLRIVVEAKTETLLKEKVKEVSSNL